MTVFRENSSGQVGRGVVAAVCKLAFIAWLVPGLIASVAVANEVAVDGDSLSCVVDVGENGACLYGNWLSGQVDLRLEGCHIFLGGIMIFPHVSAEGIAVRFEVCADHMSRKARSRYDYLQQLFQYGRLYIVASGVTQNISVNRRRSEEFKVAIAMAKHAQVPITGDNWDSSVLFPMVAEQIRNPIPISRCGGF